MSEPNHDQLKPNIRKENKSKYLSRLKLIPNAYYAVNKTLNYIVRRQLWIWVCSDFK